MSSSSPDHTGNDKTTWQFLHEFADRDGQPFKMAMGIAQCPTGDYVVADPVAIRVGIFTSKGKFKTDLKSLDKEDGNLFMPSDVAVTSGGDVVVVDKSVLVKVYDSASGHFKFGFKTVPHTNVDTEIRTQVCLAAVQVYKEPTTCKDHIFVLDILRKILTCHETDGTIVTSINARGTPNYFSVIDSNRFIVSDYSEHKIRIIDSDGNNIAVIDTPVDGLGRRANPVGSCIDRQTERFYVALGKRKGDCEISSYEIDTGKFAGCVAMKLNNPFNMIITTEGQLIVADKRTIKVYLRS